MNFIFDFDKGSDISKWFIVEDRVMGGVSNGNFYLDDDGHAKFSGSVSLENNGGFVSVRYDMQKMDIGDHEFVMIRLKGDGKNYQFRVKNDDQNYYSYIYEFETTGDWQEVAVPLKEMSPSFRGRMLDRSNFAHTHLDEISFLIANKRNENFQLLIDWIGMK